MSIKTRLCGAAVLAAVALTGLVSPASAAMRDYFGTWYAAGPTDDITRIDVRRNGDEVVLHVWGRCQPANCDWGDTPARVFAPNVGDPLWPAANAITAEYDNGREHTLLILRSVGGQLRYQAFTSFHDGSGRTNDDRVGEMMR